MMLLKNHLILKRYNIKGARQQKDSAFVKCSFEFSAYVQRLN
jgi:hypothetical protein